MYYLCLSKHGRKLYNFDDSIECGDDTVEAPMNDEQPMGVHHNVTKGDVIMHDAPNGDGHGAGFGTNYPDNASTVTMLHDMQLK